MINVEKIKPTGLFTNYIYKAIPLAFDESMSYYETLCGLLSYLKDTVIPTVNNNAGAVVELQNLYNQLHDYVENYFDNLDVQEEINNKLDEMAQSGELLTLFQNYIPFVTPQMYGAKGDGINDDTNAIKTALQNHECVYFPKGTYLISETISLSPNRIIKSNYATIIRKSNVIFDMILLNDCSNITIDKLIIDGYANEDNLNMSIADDRFSGIKIYEANNIILNDVYVKNTCNAEIEETNVHGGICILKSTNITLNDCIVNDNYGSGIILYNNSSNCVINGGYGKNNYGSAITGVSENLKISNFTALNNGYTGISLNGKNNVAVNCISNNNGQGNPWVSGTYSGFTLGHTENDAENSSLINCIAKNNTLDGITHGGGLNCKITNCTTENNGRSGIYSGNVVSSQLIQRTLIVNASTIKNNKNSGIYAKDLSNIKVSNCYITDKVPFVINNSHASIYSNDIIVTSLDNYASVYYCVSLDNADIEFIDNNINTAENVSNTQGRIVVCVSNPSNSIISNNKFSNFYYLLFETISGCHNKVSIVNDSVEISSNEDTNVKITLDLLHEQYINISYNQAQNKTYTFNIPADFYFKGSFNFIGNNITASYNASTHVLTTVTSGSYGNLNMLSKATTPYIRKF